ncbi:MAG: two-component regulator propeller domain-containing protein [Cyclobacteriaceae bacterium]
MNWTTEKLVLLCLFIFAFVYLTAQKPRFKSFDEAFPGRAVTDLELDHRGFLWIATYGGGLHKFDGLNYDSYVLDARDSTSLRSDFVTAVFEDSQNRIWVGTDKGLSLFDPISNSFKNEVLLADSDDISVIQMDEDSVGGLLVATVENGLLYFQKNVVDTAFQVDLEVQDDMKGIYVNAIANVSPTGAFIGTNSGLYFFSSSQNRVFLVPLKDHIAGVDSSIGIKSLAYDSEQKSLWLGTNTKGLIKVVLSDEEGGVDSAQIFPITKNRVMDMCHWNDHQLACATENDGLIFFDRKNHAYEKVFADQDEEGAIESNSIWKILSTDEGSFWIGYYNRGIGLYDPGFSKFQSIRHSMADPSTLAGQSVDAIVFDDEGQMWVGMDGAGVDFSRDGGQSFRHLTKEEGYTGFNDRSVIGLFSDSRDNLWVASWGGGAFLLEDGSKHIINLDFDSDLGVRSTRVMGFDEDSHGNIWIATFGSGIYWYSLDQKSIQSFDASDYRFDALANADVRDVLIDSKDNVWIGSTNGLYHLKLGPEDTTITSYASWLIQKEVHPSFNYVLSLYEDQSGNIWIGTDGAGLFKFDPTTESFESYLENWQVDKKTVCGIVEDDYGFLWITGKTGITRINLQSNRVEYFSVENDLLSQDFNYGAIAKDQSGKLYFGNIDGINWIDPGALSYVDQNPSPQLTDLRLFNKVVRPNDEGSPLKSVISETQKLTLNHLQSVFSIDFTAVDFLLSDRLQFAYYLEGLEDDWNYVGQSRSATYTSLEAGDYTFHLRASSEPGKWSDEVQLEIKVLPAWYKSRLALFAYVILFLLGLYLLYFLARLRIREKEEIVTQRRRTMENEQLTQRKLHFFTNISHEFRTPLTLIINPLESLFKSGDFSKQTYSKLNTIKRNAARLERLINELMDFRKLNSDKLKIHVHKTRLSLLIKNIVEYFDEESNSRSIDLKVKHMGDDPYVWVDSGLVEKVLFNLLSNAFKFTPDGGTISISLQESDYNLPLIQQESAPVMKLSISDTGPGLDREHLEKIFERFFQVDQFDQSYFGGTGIGLEVVKSFMELHYGAIDVESKVGEGTIFHLYFPLGKAHFSESDIVQDDPSIRSKFIAGTALYEVNEGHSQSLVADEPSLKRLLLWIDDNVELRDYVNNELNEAFNVRLAKDGKEGLDIASEIIPDVIISDVMMPEMDGFEVCKAIKAQKSTNHIPVILLTAKESIDDQMKGIKTGADLYVSKPFNMDLLKVQVEQLINTRQDLFRKYFAEFSPVTTSEQISVPEADFINNMVQFIQANINDSQLSVEVLANELNLSRSQLYRKVKSLTGENVNVLIRNMRLEKARVLIRSGSSNINEICFTVGFTSASYFTKCYKEHFGVLPTKDKKETPGQHQ